MPRRAHDFRGLTHVSRLRVLHAVQRRPGSRLAEVADAAGIHVNTARDHLVVLEDEGLVASRAVETLRRGRPPLAWFPVRTAEQNPRAAERADGARERGDLLRTVAAGEPHGASLGQRAAHQLDVLYEHLDDAGMEPTVDVDGLTIGVAPCRYRQAMAEERPLVCSVHADLVQSMLQLVPGPLEMRGLRPFVTPTSCIVELGLSTEDGPAGPAGPVGQDGTDDRDSSPAR